MSMTFDDDKILTNFLKSEGKPICREERQYALFFYNALLDVKRKGNWEAFRKLMDEDNIEKMLGLDKLKEKVKDDKLKKIELDNIHIKQVFYEATLMRDYFYSCGKVGKKKFNEELLKFVLSYSDSNPLVSLCLEEGEREKYIKELSGDAHFGSSSKSNKLPQEVRKLILKDPEDSKKGRKAFKNNEKEYFIASRLQLAKYMMNATPDILVVYTIDGINQVYVRAIECKYESGIGAYEDIFGKRRPLQIFVQRLIMTFLFSAELIEKEECGLVEVEENDDDSWKKVYGDLSIDVKKKENNDSNVGNMGVTVLKFTSEDEKSSKQSKSSEGYVKIPISNLLNAQIGRAHV